ncbi:hypothetical protein Taro_026989 [Colocasia esculenta]|uniref:Uncharacterized protein n=1 Tax=Colocasia esculenta TaxID=4460 RepID=A0A843VDD4_COLES|nr:hypothetical protein [Colocasia esculenta]
MPHFRELRPESLKVPGMGLQLCAVCSGVAADLYHQQLSSSCVQCEFCSFRELPANTALQSVIPRLIYRCCAHHGLPTCSRRPPEVVKRHKSTGGGRGGKKVGKKEGSGCP